MLYEATTTEMVHSLLAILTETKDQLFIVGKLYRLKNNDQFIIQIIEYSGVPSMVYIYI